MRFSSRHNLRRSSSSEMIWDDAPESLRAHLLGILTTTMEWNYSKIRETICPIIGRLPDPVNWSEVPNIRDEVLRLLQDAEWFEIMDIIEGIYNKLPEFPDGPDTNDFKSKYESNVNDLLLHENIGWHLSGGQLEARSDDESKQLFDQAVETLEEHGFKTSTGELREAVRDISRRPEPDITGAITHALGALEAVAKVVAKEPKNTLGEIIKAHSELFPRPLDDALQKIWGYSSNEGARHGKEGHELGYEEAFLVVGTVVAICPYLLSRMSVTREEDL